MGQVWEETEVKSGEHRGLRDGSVGRELCPCRREGCRREAWFHSAYRNAGLAYCLSILTALRKWSGDSQGLGTLTCCNPLVSASQMLGGIVWVLTMPVFFPLPLLSELVI